MCGTNASGFPIRHRQRQKRWFGFQTGDIVRATVPHGKRAGVHVGRVLCRATGRFDISTAAGRQAGIPYRFCRILHRQDGYGFTIGGASSHPYMGRLPRRYFVTCPLCGQRYTRTNFMYRGKRPVYSFDGRWLVDTHQISCYRRRTGKQPLPKPPARDPDAVQGDHEPADRQV